MTCLKVGATGTQQNSDRFTASVPGVGPEPRELMNDIESGQERVPLIQQLLDNPFLLLFIGVMVPMVVYTLWGVIDILTVPLAK